MNLNNSLKIILVFMVPIITLGLVLPEMLPDSMLPVQYTRKQPLYKSGSTKSKVAKIVTILWAIIFFSFGAVIVFAMMDSFFLNRAVLVKYLTRTALSLLILIFVTDGVMAFVKDE